MTFRLSDSIPSTRSVHLRVYSTRLPALFRHKELLPFHPNVNSYFHLCDNIIMSTLEVFLCSSTYQDTATSCKILRSILLQTVVARVYNSIYISSLGQLTSLKGELSDSLLPSVLVLFPKQDQTVRDRVIDLVANTNFLRQDLN